MPKGLEDLNFCMTIDYKMWQLISSLTYSTEVSTELYFENYNGLTFSEYSSLNSIRYTLLPKPSPLAARSNTCKTQVSIDICYATIKTLFTTRFKKIPVHKINFRSKIKRHVKKG